MSGALGQGGFGAFRLGDVLQFRQAHCPTLQNHGVSALDSYRAVVLLYAGVGILLLLTIVFHNPRNLVLVLANVPFALVGGVLAIVRLGWTRRASTSGSVSVDAADAAP